MEINTHPLAIGYFFWIFGFIGLHRCYYGSKKMALLYMVSGGLFGIGWIFDLFYMPKLKEKLDNSNLTTGIANYTLAWILLFFGGVLGLHKLYLQKTGKALLYFFTLGIFGFGVLYDFFTLNEQVSEFNRKSKK